MHMNPTASLDFALVNHQDPANSISKGSKHTFTPAACDWGFPSFYPLKDILSPGNGFLDGDSITLRVEVQVQKDGHVASVSRKEAGHGWLNKQFLLLTLSLMYRVESVS
eukprot:gene24273-9874_t